MKLFLFVFLLSSVTFASQIGDSVRYKTYFGSCPTKIVGSLTLKLVKEFESTRSLKAVRDYIEKNKIQDKYFLSDYKVDYDPLIKFLKFSYQCPEPLVKVQIYKVKEGKSYSAILVKGGLLVDPNYEVFLRSDGKLNYELPSLALPVNELEKEVQQELSKVIGKLPIEFRKKISEVILDEKGEFTLIMSIFNRPVSIFIGEERWKEKLSKLQKILSYMEKNKKIPVVINITNIKKVVVKFSDTI
jgi:hypothetical protein